ncbi:16S rRNA processing protein RimM [Candidatus Hakubella thermalkaliphila]|uniref:Ribosome maturation factor RimM n=1 Tax=Candidatus Hakubella thermalkaliphila TaxID=2754717 RepID=A0A6V8PG65_9ACTN|nr:ribosome maturation factor RimM [Candidatus Hakubella thermalkaliphila]GFP29821.1 16S rRNA processing protein RimM [Candidatus Hakubella thermalkaliphila]GFP37188.1 16S rRNA processing protein RimM [Candidatus Hakubella thermalkaliphila]GFP38830.1 16S rRNA processing protein RimM [Candidatus Hakubella thermalkaliphila]GFP42213.1 16S rRNA processing protein RimM [Candidatus Hakubella thermalkaliphila]
MKLFSHVVAQALKAHGLKGEVRLRLETDYPERISGGFSLYLSPACQEEDKLVVDSVRLSSRGPIVKFVGIDNLESAAELVGRSLYVPQDRFPSLAQDTFWVHELIGLQIFEEGGNFLGKLKEVLRTKSNDVYVVERDREGRKEEVLIPALKDVIREVDLEGNRMIVRLPEGLL